MYILLENIANSLDLKSEEGVKLRKNVFKLSENKFQSESSAL